MHRKIIIDSDVVNDDAIAILLALLSPILEIQGITIVAGAVGLEQGVKNALNILELSNRTDIPVYKGSHKPLFRDLVMGKTFHGNDGLGNLNLLIPLIKQQKQNAIGFLVDTLSDSNQRQTLVTLGPLTNIGAALLVEPRIARQIEQIIIVGGTIFAAGNYTPSIIGNCPHSEYNIYVDPEAAHIVFSSGIPIVMVGMDVTEKILLPENFCKELINTNPGKITSFIENTTKPYMDVHDHILGKKGCYIADPLAILYLLDPLSFETRDIYIQIEIKGDVTRGETVADLANILGMNPNAKVCLNVDGSRILKHINKVFSIKQKEPKNNA